MMKNILLALLFVAPGAFAVDDANALKWDPRFKEVKNAINVADYDWYDVAKLPIGGRGYIDDACPFVRVPTRFLGKVPPPVYGMGRNTTGLNLAFRTDSPELVFRYAVEAREWIDPFISPCGLDSIAIWRQMPHGEWTFRALPHPKRTGVQEFRLKWNAQDLCQVYFPIRSVMSEFRIGVKKGCSLAVVPKKHKVVHYGTSIVHGGCVSQAGLMFTSIYSRILDTDVVNLGFSGAGRMELPMADFVGGIDCELYVVDCDWNMSVDLQRQNYEPFVRRLRELRPNTPILLCGGCTVDVNPRSQEIFAKGVYDRLKAEDPAKWANLHFFGGVEQLPKKSWATHDFCHPNDIGSEFMGEAFAARIRKIMGW